MKFDVMQCPKCGAPARGTKETLVGVSEFMEPLPNGELEYSGRTEVFWDQQESTEGRRKQFILICVNDEVHEWEANLLRKENESEQLALFEEEEPR